MYGRQCGRSSGRARSSVHSSWLMQASHFTVHASQQRVCNGCCCTLVCRGWHTCKSTRVFACNTARPLAHQHRRPCTPTRKLICTHDHGTCMRCRGDPGQPALPDQPLAQLARRQHQQPQHLGGQAQEHAWAQPRQQRGTLELHIPRCVRGVQVGSPHSTQKHVACSIASRNIPWCIYGVQRCGLVHVVCNAAVCNAARVVQRCGLPGAGSMRPRPANKWHDPHTSSMILGHAWLQHFCTDELLYEGGPGGQQ